MARERANYTHRLLWLRWTVIGLACGAAMAAVVLLGQFGVVALWQSIAGRVGLGVAGAAMLGFGGRGLRAVATYSHGFGRAVGTYATLGMCYAGCDGLYAAATGGPLSFTAAGQIILTGIGLTFAFLLGLALVRLVLRPNFPPLAVAGEVLEEALRMKLAVALLILIVLIIAGLPFIIGQSDRLQYRIQQFISYSFGLTTFLLALLTIFLACHTLSSEIRDKQIFTVMTKPIDRGSYLLGKWLGIVLLDAVLLVIAGGAIYGFITFYLAAQPARDALDRRAVDEQVLTARVSADPVPPESVDAEVAQRLERLKAEQSEAFIAERGGEARVADEIRQQVLTEWRSLGPYGRERFQSVFVFPDMGRAAELGRSVQLQYKIKVSGQMQERQTRIWWGANGRMLTAAPKQVPANIRQTESIPTEVIGEDGRLELLAVNLNPEASISFPAKDGMQLLYKVDEFTPNFIRGLAMVWFKLAFLAALGLAAATFVGFPVAVLLCLLVFAAASASDYILDSLRYFAKPDPQGDVSLVSLAMKWITTLFTVPLERYADYRPTQALVEGRYLSWRALAGCAAWIGAMWTGVAGLVAWFVFQRKELARVQV